MRAYVEQERKYLHTVEPPFTDTPQLPGDTYDNSESPDCMCFQQPWIADTQLLRITVSEDSVTPPVTES